MWNESKVKESEKQKNVLKDMAYDTIDSGARFPITTKLQIKQFSNCDFRFANATASTHNTRSLYPLLAHKNIRPHSAAEIDE